MIICERKGFVIKAPGEAQNAEFWQLFHINKRRYIPVQSKSHQVNPAINIVITNLATPYHPMQKRKNK